MPEESEHEYFPWYSEEEYNKMVGGLRRQIGGILHPLRKYGQGDLCDGAETAIMELVEQFGMKVRGVDVPYGYSVRLVSNFD